MFVAGECRVGSLFFGCYSCTCRVYKYSEVVKTANNDVAEDKIDWKLPTYPFKM